MDKYTITPETQRIYVNFVLVETGIYDISLILGENIPQSTDQQTAVPPAARTIIKMSTMLAKVLMHILTKHLRIYEQQVGSITIPKSILHDLGMEELI